MSDDADLAELARRALERPDAVSVMGDAVERVARALRVEHVTILELSPADQRLRLRAGIGWGGGDVAFGVIGAHATEPRAFTEHEVALVEGVAAIVGAAIANQRRALDVHDGVLQSLVVDHYSLGAGDVEAAAEAIRAAHEEARALVEELLGDVTTEPLPGDLRRAR